MNTLSLCDIPFSSYVGLTESDREDALLMLPDASDYHNHLGTVHASAQFTLAETASGFIMQDAFGDMAADVVAVVRKAEVKYSRPAQGPLYATGRLNPDDVAAVKNDIRERGLAKVRFMVLVQNESRKTTMKAKFEWSVLLKKEDGNG